MDGMVIGKSKRAGSTPKIVAPCTILLTNILTGLDSDMSVP